MGTSNSIGNPLFFREPVARTATFRYSWTDQEAWTGYLGGELNPFWPYTVSRLVFYPDFTNQVNKAEEYARSKSGVIVEKEDAVLPAFLMRLRQASGLIEEGLIHYRDAALESPESKRIQALKEVIIAEQLLRTLQSNHAILEFEDLRLQFVKEKDQDKAGNILDIMEGILRDEIDRTELSLLAVTRDSRLGFQQECDYVYTPYSLKEKLGVLQETLDTLIPSAREKMS